MTLEFEKLTADVDNMAQAAAERQARQAAEAALTLAALHQFATDWEAIEAALALAEVEADEKFFRAARPLDESEPMDARVAAPRPPDRATILATDGSQIFPDRHAALAYFLTNVGLIAYYHGDARAPEVFSEPLITYYVPDHEDNTIDNYQATVERDRREIQTLANQAFDYHRYDEGPVLGIVDQRLLYWPFGGTEAQGEAAMRDWNEAMVKVRDSGALLCGYIDRPSKRSIITLLQALTAESPEDLRMLGKPNSGPDLTDTQLFGHLLQPGERSRVFVDISRSNTRFRDLDAENEVCFFYLNPLTPRDEPAALGLQPIARVDIPLSVARNAAAVAIVHSLLVDQCRLLGGYPYVLSRADELAVVGRKDEASLNDLIAGRMLDYGLNPTDTGKAQGKDLARGARARFGAPR